MGAFEGSGAVRGKGRSMREKRRTGEGAEGGEGGGGVCGWTGARREWTRARVSRVPWYETAPSSPIA